MNLFDLTLTDRERATLLEFLHRTTLRPAEIERYAALRQKLIDAQPRETQPEPKPKE